MVAAAFWKGPKRCSATHDTRRVDAGDEPDLRYVFLLLEIFHAQQTSGINESPKLGINVTSYYMSYIFINALGISELLARILAAAGSVDYLIFACLAYFVIERYGRRKVSASNLNGRYLNRANHPRS